MSDLLRHFLERNSTMNTMYTATLFLLFTASLYSNINLLDLQKTELDALAIKHGTDKGSKCPEIKNRSHNYACKYDSYFSSIKNEPIKFLEIGFEHGSSALMWQEYFPNAELHFIDVQSDFFKIYSKGLTSRCHLHVGNQENPHDLLNVMKKINDQLDIILDDGGHTMKQQIVSFKTLFPFVRSGGVYIIEDLHTSYWIEQYGNYYGGHGTFEAPLAQDGSAICFLMALVHDVNYIAARTGSASEQHCPQDIYKTLNYYQKNIKSIHFYSGMCLIFKN